MPLYVDGYVAPVPKRKIAAYRRIAQRAGKIWREHGALEFRECVGDDLASRASSHSRAWPGPSPARPSCSPGWCTGRGRTVTG